jgi:hypothetical protein
VRKAYQQAISTALSFARRPVEFNAVRPTFSRLLPSGVDLAAKEIYRMHEMLCWIELQFRIS